MKKIFNMTLLVIGCLLIASCSDDEYTEKTNSVYVTEGQTELPAVGATQTITVAGEGLKAEADDAWLGVSVNGNVITVTADANYSRESRHTFVTITAANGDFLQVNVSQLGAVFVLDAPENIIYNDNETTVTYDFNTNLNVSVSTSVTWLKAEYADGKLTISADENNSGHIRTGYVYYQAGTLGDKIEVTQGDIDKDVVGKYYIFGGVDPDAEDPEDADVAFLTTITKNDAGYTFSFPSLGLSMPVTFDTADLTMTLAGGQSMGPYGPYYVYSLIGDAALGYISWSTAVTMTAGLKQYDETAEDGTYTVGGEFQDDGKWDGYASDAFSLGAFSANAATSANFKGTLTFFTDVTIVEYLVPAEAKSTAAAKVRKQLAKGLAPAKKYVPVAE